MQKAEKRLQTILHKYNSLPIKDRARLDVTGKLFKSTWCTSKLPLLIFPLAFFFFWPSYSNVCFLEMPSDASKWFREPETCDLCEGVTHVVKIGNISSVLFEEFISTAKPLVVTDGAKNWSASKTFTFDFFKELYASSSFDETFCQFFPYKTEFNSLQEALRMAPERAQLQQGAKPWYIGWSNCNDEAGKILRKHYDVPYFLPKTSENIALNWIFMGGPGQGAHMHVDNVQFPSWQAQLKGKKLWRLAPPPECYYKCKEIEVIVEPGEMIVVDTNRWYHQTFILPGEISITIGSEFD